MTDHEVERRLGYTPCVCANLDGTWHPECYRGKTQADIDAAYKKAFAKARRYLKAMDAKAASNVVRAAASIGPTP